MADLFDDSSGNGKRREVASYDYVDENGTLLYQVVRFEPKDFRQRRPDGSGGWVWKMGDVRRVLYRLPAVIEAVKAGRTVYVAEGEKDVATLVSFGLDATCNPGGAGKWRPEYSETLRGAHVVILPDADKPGREHAAGIAAALSGVAADVCIVELPVGKDVTAWRDSHGGTREKLETLILHPPEPARIETNCTKSPTQAEQLVALTADDVLWHTPEGEAFATIPTRDGHRENWQVQSKSYRDALRQRFFDRTAKIPANQALIDAIGLIEGRAEFEGECHPAHLRIAELNGTLYLDLCDQEWRAVEVTPTGWRIVENPPVRFRRSRGMTALPIPEAGGSVEALRPFINGDAETFVLVVAWLVQALHPTGPYMVLVLLGEQGSGKSFLARLLRSLIDPSTMPLRSLPREERDLAIAATNSYIIAIDNVSGVSIWLSDGICRLSTGGGLPVRKLYTDQEEVFLGATRPVILNGIEGAATRADLLDRSVLVTLESIGEDSRRNERELLAAFEEAVPGILGGLMDAASAALANRDKVETNLPRMADATSWIVAAEAALPWEAGAFLNAYAANRREGVAIALDADTVGTLIVQLMQNKAKWIGSATSLMSDLDALLGEHAKRPPDWPGNARVLAGRVFRLAPALRARGIVASRVFGQHTRMISLENTDGWQGRTDDAPTTQERRKNDAPTTQESAQKTQSVARSTSQTTQETQKPPSSSVGAFEKEREKEGRDGVREGRNSCVSCALASSTPCREPGEDDLPLEVDA